MYAKLKREYLDLEGVKDVRLMNWEILYFEVVRFWRNVFGHVKITGGLISQDFKSYIPGFVEINCRI